MPNNVTLHNRKTVQVVRPDGVQLEVSFQKLRDRFQHTISIVRSSSTIALLSSIEGLADDDFPPSPPQQQLSIEQRGEDKVALLVGMAGKSHWSMSVETVQARNAIIFDVACRLTRKPQWLGSSYQLASALQVDVANRKILLDEDSILLNALETDFRFDANHDRLVAEPLTQGGELPSTVRWRYEFQFEV